MKKLIIFTVTLLAVFAISSSRAEAVLEIDGRYWLSTLDSNVQVTDGGLLGTDIDLVDDLGIDDEESFPEIRVRLGLGSHHLRYSYMSLSWDGSTNIADLAGIDFGGTNFAQTTLVNTSLDIDYHRLGYEYDLIDILRNRITLIAELKYLEIETELDAPIAALNESESTSVPIPTVGIGVQAGLPALLDVSAEVTGIGLGSDAYFIDAEAMINFHPAPLFVVSGGYRYINLHAEDNDDKLDFLLDGPFLMVKIGF